jgi:hypothetical protein
MICRRSAESARRMTGTRNSSARALTFSATIGLSALSPPILRSIAASGGTSSLREFQCSADVTATNSNPLLWDPRHFARHCPSRDLRSSIIIDFSRSDTPIEIGRPLDSEKPVKLDAGNSFPPKYVCVDAMTTILHVKTVSRLIRLLKRRKFHIIDTRPELPLSNSAAERTASLRMASNNV